MFITTCIDGRRLIPVTQDSKTTEFRTWPDNQIKVVQHFDDFGASYFTAYYPTGEFIEYGRTAGSRPSANEITLIWLANEQRDARGNGIQYGYCFVKEGDQVKEFALDEIRYGSFEGNDSVEANRAVSFVYGAKEHGRTSFEGGHEFQQSLQLDKVVTSVKGTLARQYELEYDESDTTGQTLLTSVQECAGNGDCYERTRFHYGFTFERTESGIPFEPTLTDVVSLADPRGPRIGDLTSDGAPDVAIHVDNRLHIFKNSAVDPDVLVGISNGNNDHDPDEPQFVPNVSIEYAHLTDESKTKGQLAKDSDFYVSKSDPANGCEYPRHCAVGSMRLIREYATNDGQGGQRRYGLRYRDGRFDRLTNEFLGFGKRILSDLDTGETTVDVYDNVTKVQIGAREVYPFIGQIQQQWSWVPGLPTQPNPNQVEMVFADRTIDVVPTNGNETYFTLPTKMHTRRMQGSFSGAGTIEAYVGLVATLENAKMLRDSTVEIVDFDEFRNVLEVDVSTVGVDTSMSNLHPK